LHAACVAWSIDRPNPTAQVLVITDGKVAPPRGLVVSEPNEQQSLWGEPLAALLMRNGFQGPVHMLVIALEDECDVALPNLRTLCGLTLGVLFLAGSLLYGADVGQVASCQLTCVPACARARVVLCKPTRCGKAAAPRLPSGTLISSRHLTIGIALQMDEIEAAVEEMLEVDEFQRTPTDLTLRDNLGSIQ
jgi:hypothetical protein